MFYLKTIAHETALLDVFEFSDQRVASHMNMLMLPFSKLEAGVWHLSRISFSIHTKQRAATLLKPNYYLKYLLSLVHTYLAGATEFLS